MITLAEAGIEFFTRVEIGPEVLRVQTGPTRRGYALEIGSELDPNSRHEAPRRRPASPQKFPETGFPLGIMP
jgi:hypothetical protein